jgi:hypothetical protein
MLWVRVRGRQQKAVFLLTTGFVRIGHFGFLAHRRRGASLSLCFQLLAQSDLARTKAEPEEKLIPHHDLFGPVPDVASQWSSSNGSVPLSFEYGLRQFPPHDNHDTIFLITASALPQTPALYVCPLRLPHGVETLERPETKTV